MDLESVDTTAELALAGPGFGGADIEVVPDIVEPKIHQTSDSRLTMSEASQEKAHKLGRVEK
jgi:hypothetical protein